MNVDQCLDAVLLHLLQNHIEDTFAVHCISVCIAKIWVKGVVLSVCGVQSYRRQRIAVFPGKQQFCRYRKTNDIDAVICNRREQFIHICTPKTMREILCTVHTKPVCTGQPHLISLRIIQFAALCVQPVIVVIIRCGSCQTRLNRRNAGRETSCHHHAGNSKCSKFFTYCHG